jgi:cellulose synthase/poly-beta-1,6-N-acetylglucosamine synthase-like glycosyltransferase
VRTIARPLQRQSAVPSRDGAWTASRTTTWPNDPVETLSVSVLVAAWNEERTVGRCLDSLLAIECPVLEIIVCAGGTDRTFAIAKGYQSESVIVLEQRPGEGKQQALRRCFERSHGEIIYLTDADCLVPGGVFQAVIAPIRAGACDAATGTSRPREEQIDASLPFFQWSILRAVERRRPATSEGLLGRNCAVRRDALQAAGAFNNSVPIGTDYHLARRLLESGARIRFVPAAVETLFPERPGAVLRQQSRWLRSIFLHGPSFSDRAQLTACVRTVALGTGFFLFPLTWPWTKRRGMALWFSALASLTIIRYRYSQALAAELSRSMPTSYLLKLPALTIVDVASWAWPFVDGFSRARRLRW